MANTRRKKTSAVKKTAASGRKSSSGKRRSKAAKPDSRLGTDICLLLLLAFSLLLLLSNFGLVGIAGEAFGSFFFGMFGLLEYIFPIFLFFAGAFLIANRGKAFVLRKLFGALAFFCLVCVLIHLMTIGYDRSASLKGLFYQSAEDRLGGGLLGGGLTQFLCGIFGTAGTYVIVIALMAVSAIILTQNPLLAGVSVCQRTPGRSGAFPEGKADAAGGVSERSRKEEKKAPHRAGTGRAFQKRGVYAADISGFCDPAG